MVLSKNGVHFELSPNKVASLWLIGYCPPKTAPYDPFDQVRIIAEAHVCLVDDVWIGRFDVQPIRVVYLPDKVMIAQDLFLAFLRVGLFVIESKDEGLLFETAFANGDKFLNGIHFLFASSKETERSLLVDLVFGSTYSPFLAFWLEEQLSDSIAFIFLKNKNFVGLFFECLSFDPASWLQIRAPAKSKMVVDEFEIFGKDRYRVIHLLYGVRCDRHVGLIRLFAVGGLGGLVSQAVRMGLFFPVLKFFGGSHHLAFESDFLVLFWGRFFVELDLDHFGEGAAKLHRWVLILFVLIGRGGVETCG